jgi:fluoride exporter
VARPSAWALLVIGVLGSYTTVSSFSFQTLVLLRAGEPGGPRQTSRHPSSLCLGAAALAWLGAGWMVSA